MSAYLVWFVVFIFTWFTDGSEIPNMAGVFTAINEIPREWISVSDHVTGIVAGDGPVKFENVWNSSETVAYLVGGVAWRSKDNSVLIPCVDGSAPMAPYELCIADLNAKKMRVTHLNLAAQTALTAVLNDFVTDTVYGILTLSIGENAVLSSLAQLDPDTGEYKELFNFGDYGIVSYSFNSKLGHAYFLLSDRGNYTDHRLLTYDLSSSQVVFNVTTYVGIQDIQFDGINNALLCVINSKTGGSYISILNTKTGHSDFLINLSSTRFLAPGAGMQSTDFRSSHYFVTVTDRLEYFRVIVNTADLKQPKIVRDVKYDQTWLGGLALFFTEGNK